MDYTECVMELTVRQAQEPFIGLLIVMMFCLGMLFMWAILQPKSKGGK